MTVVCKTNITPTQNIEFNLTIGKVYEVYRCSPVWVYVIDDTGSKEHYIERMFTTLIELRDMRLEELLK